METDTPFSSPHTAEDIDGFVRKYIHSATNVLKCKTGQAGIVRYLQNVEGYSEDDARRLSFPLFDAAKRKLNRTQIPKAIIGFLFIAIALIGPLLTWIIFGFIFWITIILPIIIGVALLTSINRPKPLEE